MNKKKFIITIIIITIVVVVTGGIYAYLTDTDQKTNVFTHGSVKIDLTEEHWNPSNGQDLRPGNTIAKDPAIDNIGKNSAYVYIKIEQPLVGLMGGGEGSVFSYTINNGWTLLSTTDCSNTSKTVSVYYYNTELAKNTSTAKLFNNVTVNNFNNSVPTTSLDMHVTGYAVQTRNLPSGTTVANAYNTYFYDATTVCNPSVNANFEVGDYFNMTPTSSSYSLPSSYSGYEYSQSINPQELTLWRVIKINPDGGVDAISEYTSSSELYLNQVAGYQHYIKSLQLVADQYQNSTYTVSARMLGYDGQTPSLSDVSALNSGSAPSSTSTSTPTTGVGAEFSGGLLGDTLYLKDYNLVSSVYSSDPDTYGTSGLMAYKVNAQTTVESYWIASRAYFYNRSNYFAFGGRSVNDSGKIVTYLLRTYQGGWQTLTTGVNYLRPIITLKPSVVGSSGDGTKASPYSISNS